MIALMPGGVRGQVKIQMESIQKWISIYRMILIRFFITFWFNFDNVAVFWPVCPRP